MRENGPYRFVIETRLGAAYLASSLMLFLVMSSVALSLVPIVRPELQEAPFSLSDSQIGLLTSVFMLTFSAGAFLMGMAVARWGGRTVIAGAGFLVVGSVLFAFSTSYPWFLVARFLQGMGGSAAVPTSTSLIAQTVAPRFHGWAFGILGCGHGLGVVFALLIMPSIQEAGGYRAAFLATAGIALVLTLVAASHRTIRGRSRHTKGDVSCGSVIRGVGAVAVNRRLLLLVLVNIGALAVLVGILTWTPSFLHDQRGASLAIAAYLTAALGVAQILGNIAGASAMARWGKPLVIVVGMGVMFAATALVPLAPGLVLVIACVMVAGFLTMALFPAVMGSIPEIVPRLDQVGPASGYLSITNLVGTMLAPWLFGVLLDTYGTGEDEQGYLLGYWLLALFAVLGTLAAVAYLVVRRRSESKAVDRRGACVKGIR